ncbi:MAG: DUF2207 domain-containing protein [Candidatus Muirbacterium halophilum]|nr:DUF2207 domain-containing protein [Candidatus Muirbacterium halophilum]MCK9476494.1 DUF2207 domain-containing protein [Candidatus Muirbacterium halophilum]
MSKLNSKLSFFLILLFLIVFTSFSKEKIIDFNVLFELSENQNMTVTETITVKAEGRDIKRGIFREFPTSYKTFWRGSVSVPFEVISVKKDGYSEPYSIKNEPNGKRIYIGNNSKYLKDGIYEYEIKYNTANQLYFGKNHDELYWNITGQSWAFDIEHAICEFSIPENIREGIIETEAYTGSQGQMGDNYDFYYNDNGNPVFETTKILIRNSGISAKIKFAKGFLKEPSFNQKVALFIKDNLHVIFAIFGFILITVYYLIMWSKFGVDPPKGTIIPRFDSPENMTASESGFLLNMGWDDKFLSSDIIELAIMGFLKINEITEGKFQVEKLKECDDKATKYQQEFFNALFSSGNTLTIEKSQFKTIALAKNKLLDHMDKRFNKVLYHNNFGITALGALLTLLMIGISLFFGGSLNSQAIFISVWLFIWNIGVFALVNTAYKGWVTYFKTGQSIGNTIGASLFSLPFLIGDLVAIFIFGKLVSFPLIVIIISCFILNIVFYELMKAPTVYGRKIMDKIEGLKMYLSVAEKEWLQKFTPPEKTPEEFEKMLPYAIALKVENEWGEKFTSILKIGSEGQENYKPSWYYGRSLRGFSPSSFAGNMSNSFGQAISSASTPASSGGSGGAGGGGGGGGGGGW